MNKLSIAQNLCTVLYVKWMHHNVVCLVFRSAPPSSKFFSVKCTPNVQYRITPPPQEISHLSPIPLNGNSVLFISMGHASQNENDSKVSRAVCGDTLLSVFSEIWNMNMKRQMINLLNYKTHSEFMWKSDLQVFRWRNCDFYFTETVQQFP